MISGYKSVLEKRIQFVRKSFFQRFGSLPLPSCHWCLRKVDAMGFDYDPDRNQVVVWVECHGDRTEFRQNYDEIMKHNTIRMKLAFAPGQATRVNGKLMSGIQSSHERIIQRRNQPEQISEEDKRDILEIADPNKKLLFYEREKETHDTSASPLLPRETVQDVPVCPTPKAE
jgi:hypothetical protein